MTEFETDFSDDGERVVASQKDWNYYSHLSIYRFASFYTKGLRVLDAGCGTGYGTSYLARAGAQHVTGIDVSENAISYCKAHFSEPATDFIVADLSIEIPVPSCSVDAIFSSQAMEHLSNIEDFLSECRRVLKPNGLMVVAVPAIVSKEQLEENIWNRFHLINLTPLGWYTKTRRNFARVHAFSHWPSTRFSDRSENSYRGHDHSRDGLRFCRSANLYSNWRDRDAQHRAGSQTPPQARAAATCE